MGHSCNGHTLNGCFPIISRRNLNDAMFFYRKIRWLKGTLDLIQRDIPHSFLVYSLIYFICSLLWCTFSIYRVANPIFPVLSWMPSTVKHSKSFIWKGKILIYTRNNIILIYMPLIQFTQLRFSSNFPACETEGEFQAICAESILDMVASESWTAGKLFIQKPPCEMLLVCGVKATVGPLSKNNQKLT